MTTLPMVIYPIKERSKVLDKFKQFKPKVGNQHDLKIKMVRSNRVGGGDITGAVQSVDRS